MTHSASFATTKHVVLIGGGHSHALVLKSWGARPLPGARLTVINPGSKAPYSGMLPGFVAGHYSRDALDIDLEKLCRYAGAHLILGAANDIDLNAREVHVPGHAPVPFDIAAVDIGITSDMPGMPGFAEHAIPAKPLGPFAARWDDFRNANGPADVAVIGGGIAGIELILAMAYALKKRNRLNSATVIDSATALSAVSARAAKVLRKRLAALGVTLIENVTVAKIDATHITLSDGKTVPSQFTTGAAGARPYDWLAHTGLTHSQGFVDVEPSLLTSDPNVFATGDCAHLTQSPRPKAGVYAVRQAPILFQNLRAMLEGQPLVPYEAQSDYLKLVSLGGKSALGEKFNMLMSGPHVWAMKNWIDQSFMAQFRDLNGESSRLD